MVQTSSSDGQYVTANGVNMYYEESGSGEPLIFLHGGMATGKTVEHLVPAFSQRFRVIRPDMRGHGKTVNPGGEFSYRLMADDIAAFIHAMNLGQASVCGWSDGGQIALELGMHYSDTVKCMVVGAAWYQFSSQYQRALKAMGWESPGTVNIERVRQALGPIAEMWHTLHATIEDQNRWEKLATQISTMWWTPLGYTSDDFEKIKTPTLILLGDRDQIIPVEEATAMHRMIPDSELAIVPNSNHSLPLSRAELFTSIVLDFLARHG
jgi:pimeloyl-ACP methyl ester carboxylesterase